MAIYMNSQQAAAALGIQKQTLYAYVSRGLIQSIPGIDQRDSQFRAADIERLAVQKSRGRKPRQVAKATLDWGLPVMESGLTLIADGGLYYRGYNAIELARSSSLEDVARLLWKCPPDLPFPEGSAGAERKPSLLWRKMLSSMACQSPYSRSLPLFALGQTEIQSQGWRQDQRNYIAAAIALLRLLGACVLGIQPGNEPLHEQCRRTWRLSAAGADIVRTALVLCADHELNASSFTARCIASTGASIGSAIVGGLAALSGPLHGGFTEKVEALFNEIQRSTEIQAAMLSRLDRGEILPGFGHPLYPDGDPRAKALLALLPVNKVLDNMLSQAERLTGQKPSIDFALVATRRSLGLPMGSAFGLFAIARVTGWIAHILEQRQQGTLIRPRATYTGSPPATESPIALSHGRVIRFT